MCGCKLHWDQDARCTCRCPEHEFAHRENALAAQADVPVTAGREDVTRALAQRREQIAEWLCDHGTGKLYSQNAYLDRADRLIDELLADVLASLSDERLAQAEAKVARVKTRAAFWRDTPDELWRGFEIFDVLDRALSGDAAPPPTQAEKVDAGKTPTTNAAREATPHLLAWHDDAAPRTDGDTR